MTTTSPSSRRYSAPSRPARRCRRPRPARTSGTAANSTPQAATARRLSAPNGFGDELGAAPVDDQATSGALTLLRGADREPFSPADAAPEPPDGEDAAGVVVLAPDGSTTFSDEVAAAWIQELGGNGSLPPVVTEVASRARSAVAGTAPDGRIARARVRAASGRWLAVRASALGDESDAQVAVMIEPARPHEVAPLVADHCRLTERERDVTRLVAQGLSTDAIAARLYLSSWTVQDHLKAIFEKAGVTTRGELVARVFFQQRAPQL